MPTRIENSEAPLSEERLREVERDIGLNFPEQYRRFLLAHNGGTPVPAVFDYKIEKGAYTDSIVDWFLAIYDGEHDNFEDSVQVYKSREPRIPNNFIPIAHDPGGNLICISASGGDLGAVYFWDHEREADRGETPSYANVHLIADSFDEFLAGLRDLNCK
jgi:cell wall assembly regulator SMI1